MCGSIDKLCRTPGWLVSDPIRTTSWLANILLAKRPIIIMAIVASPVSFAKRATPYPSVGATCERLPLSKVLRPGAPTVFHSSPDEAGAGRAPSIATGGRPRSRRA